MAPDAAALLKHGDVAFKAARDVTVARRFLKARDLLARAAQPAI